MISWQQSKVLIIKNKVFKKKQLKIIHIERHGKLGYYILVLYIKKENRIDSSYTLYYIRYILILLNTIQSLQLVLKQDFYSNRMYITKG